MNVTCFSSRSAWDANAFAIVSLHMYWGAGGCRCEAMIVQRFLFVNSEYYRY
ncbi:hypothetical protein PSP6_20014 [Paraburkholderia tropica]|nr:hypothetical protein PSP6_20014 [Paraburkholderia tropica]